MLKEVVFCDECGKPGQDPIEDMCGEWLGTPENGYACPDIICEDCLVKEEGLEDEDLEDNEPT